MKTLTTGVAIVVVGLCLATVSQASEPFRLLRQDGQTVKWGRSVLGTGARVSYAFVTGPTIFRDTVNCGGMTSLDNLLETSEITWTEMRTEVAAAFAIWEKNADIEFDAIDDPATAQILIGAQLKPRWNAFANVTHRMAPGASVGMLETALICLNPKKLWKIGFDNDPDTFDLRYAIAHEIGHAIGLDHPGPAGQLMSFKYLEAFRSLQPGDIAGAVALYGKSRPGLGMVTGETALEPAPRTIAVETIHGTRH